MQEMLPRFSDVPLLNEVYTLSLHLLKGLREAAPALALRLRSLVEFAQSLARGAAEFRERNPAETEVISAHDRALEELKQSVGGLNIYLEEGRIQDLSNALSLFDRAINQLAACMKAMKMVEYDRLQFSEMPAPDRLYQAIKAGQADIRRESGEVRAFYATLDRHVTILESEVWMGAKLKHEAVPALRGYLARVAEALDGVEGGGPGRMDALKAVREAGEDFDEYQEQLEDLLADRPDISGSAHFHELISMMEGAYAGQIPNHRLQEKVEVISRMQSGLRGRLKLQALHAPQEQATVDRILPLLDLQERGLELVLAFVQTGEREMLQRAYDEIVPATVELVELKLETAPAEEAPAAMLGCPFCGQSNPPGSARCGQCARPLAAPGVSGGLDLYDSGVSEESEAPLSENFAFVVQVIDDVSSGLVGPRDAVELLAPFWDTIHEVDARLGPWRSRCGARGRPSWRARTRVSWRSWKRSRRPWRTCWRHSTRGSFRTLVRRATACLTWPALWSICTRSKKRRAAASPSETGGKTHGNRRRSTPSRTMVASAVPTPASSCKR
ncbi:MAG: hypothetical protein FJX76_13690 [Armatimonadetes bacterium]|nr:hypothetical protein [Armatimonadota bacterium]